MTECRVDTIIAGIFRYSLVFGLATHLYDSTRHKLVYSPKALCYSLFVHATSVLLFPAVYQHFQTDGYFKQAGAGFFEQLFRLLLGIQFFAVFTSIASQWTSRARAATLYNEIIQIWHRDMAHLQRSPQASRESGRIFTFRTTSTTLIITATTFGAFSGTMAVLSIVQSVCMLILSNIIIAVMFQFSCGMIFSDYLFRILNHNLTRVVQEICDVRHTRGSRRTAAKLRKELSTIGQIHSHLQQWVVRFKNLYQIEFLLILMTFFLSQIFTLFLVCFILHSKMIALILSRFLVACSSSVLCGCDLLLHFCTCGRVLDACDGAARIMKDLPSHSLCCNRLERCIEMLCLQLKRAKLRLRICGLVDVHGNTGFAMAQAAMMYIILLIQIDYEHF